MKKEHKNTIEEAAEEYMNGELFTYPIIKRVFIDGAKSPEARKLHTKDMYTEEEVLDLLEFVNDRLPDLFSRFNSDKELKEWFETNKKNKKI